MSRQTPRAVAVIGTGTIALGWIALFAAAGRDVRVSSTRTDAREHLDAALPAYAASLPGGAREPREILARVRVVPEVGEVLSAPSHPYTRALLAAEAGPSDTPGGE
ncbi:3-hydroxyacyl-CoA dehydrogenase NAD-binding domain-containing protein [Streptomyces sp. DT18]